ncbi:hypothetical protein D9M68_810190 [compost metagenome]
MQQFVRVFVVADGFLNITTQAMHGQVHLGQADGGGVFLCAVEGQQLAGVLLQAFYEMRALHKHAARAAGGVEHLAVVGFDEVGDHPN